MKRISHFCVLVLLSISAMGQSIKTETVTYQEVRLPLNPIDINSYQFTVISPYPENNNDAIEMAKQQYEQDLANYPQVVEEAKRKYEEALANYDKDVEVARENYKLESEQYQSLSAVERLALQDQKPQLRLPSKPTYYEPSKPQYREPDLSSSITYSPEQLANYVKLDGFDKGTDNALTGTITLYSFEKLDPVRNSEEKSVYDSQQKKTVKRITYFYETSYKRPVYIKLEHNGQVLADEMLEGTSEYIVLKSDQAPNMLNLERKSVEESLSKASDYVNNNYGYTKVERRTEISYVKNKDGLYDDLEDARDKAVAGLMNYSDGKSNSDLNAAISIWEKALTESDPEDRKARIDEKVTIEILKNLIKVYLTTYQTDKAQETIVKFKRMDLSYSEKQELEGFELELKDKTPRAQAN